MLFRGVDEMTDQQNEGRLLPKGNNVEVFARYDGKWSHDGKIKRGPCQTNTARAHQIESGLYEGCGISTTRKEERAVLFATSGNMVDGYIYVIDEELLVKANVRAHEFEDSEYPFEFEVTLIEQSGAPIPDCVIVDKYGVRADGTRK